jgi:hypothetical protein
VLGGVQPLFDAGGGLVCTFYFLLGVCNIGFGGFFNGN